jgi:hypothetical protein
MSNRKREHRIYLYIAERLKFLGMTTFELMLGCFGFGGFMIYSGGIGERFAWLLGGWGSIVVNRRLTKGKDLKPILVFFGIMPGPSKQWIPHEVVVCVA